MSIEIHLIHSFLKPVFIRWLCYVVDCASCWWGNMLSCCRGAHSCPAQRRPSWEWECRVRGEETTLQSSPCLSKSNKASYSSVVWKEGFSLGSAPAEVVGSPLGGSCHMKSICLEYQIFVKHNEMLTYNEWTYGNWYHLRQHQICSSLSDTPSRTHWTSRLNQSRGHPVSLPPSPAYIGEFM